MPSLYADASCTVAISTEELSDSDSDVLSCFDFPVTPLSFSPVRAFFTAPIIPFELYVAPDTTSTSKDCDDIILSITPFALLKNASSSVDERISMEVIFLSMIVTATVTGPLKPVAEPLYTPSARSNEPVAVCVFSAAFSVSVSVSVTLSETCCFLSFEGSLAFV